MASIAAAIAISRCPSTSIFSSSQTLKRGVVVATPFRCRAEFSPNDKPALAKSALLGISTNTWCAGIGGLGFLETAYLTYLKVSGNEAFCPANGSSCGDVLNSDYSYVFGLPLPLIGLIAYGFVTLLALQRSRKSSLPGIGETDARLILLGTTTTMATSSAYFLYVLSTKFPGTSCLYCVVSALLSFSLFFVTLKDFSFEEIREVVGLELAIIAIVVTALTNTYSSANQQLANDVTLEPYETEITNPSSPYAISLAKHLKSIGAKMYGAFWCSHCNEQKQMFGRDAVKLLEYVECFPYGAGKGKTMAMECAAAGLEGFPTWIIDGKRLSGEQDLAALAEASGFASKDSQAGSLSAASGVPENLQS